MEKDPVRIAQINILAIIRQKFTSHIDTLLNLREDLFPDTDARRTFQILKSFYAEERPFEDVLLIDELQSRGESTDIIDDIAIANVNPLSVHEYIDLLVKDKQRDAMDSFVRQLEANNITDFRASTNRLLSIYEELESIRVPRIRSTNMEGTRKIMESSLAISSFSTGFKQVDDILGGGFRAEEMTTLGAPPGGGKSSLAAVFGLNVSRSIEGSVIFFSKEMTKQKIYQRLLANIARVPVNFSEEVALGTRLPDPILKAKIESAKQQLDAIGDNYYFFDVQDSPVISTDTIAQEVSAHNIHREKEGKKPVSLVIVDYLQYLNYEQGRNEPAHQAIGKIAERLKAIALREHCHMLVIAAVNRASGRSMQLEAFRDSSGIEFNTDNALLMVNCRDFLPAGEINALGAGWNEEYMNPIMLKGAKVRNGMVGRNGYLAFNGSLQTFRDMNEDEVSTLRSLMTDHASSR